MRLVAMLASLAVAVAAATLPASLVAMSPAPGAQMSAADEQTRDDEGSPFERAQSEPEDDDLDDDGLDDVDDLLAVFDTDRAPRVHGVREAGWPMRAIRAPLAPQLEDALRPPIAA